MKKLIMFVALFVLFGCEVGKFDDNRNRLHEMNGNTSEICETNPERCVSGVPW